MKRKQLYKQLPWLLILPVVVGGIGVEADTFFWIQLANGFTAALAAFLTLLAYVSARPLWHSFSWGALAIVAVYATLFPAVSDGFWVVVAALLEEG